MQYLAFRCNILPNDGINWDGTTISGKLVSGLGGSRRVCSSGPWRVQPDAK
jgi:hypothetical protein